MFSLSWLRERGISRGRPSGRRRAAKAVALGFMVATTFLQTGCRSGGFGNGCGLFSPCGFPARATTRIMQPFRRIGGGFGGCSDGCGTGAESGVVEYAAPSAVIAPAVPLGAPTTIGPGSTLPSTVSPSVESPTELEALPSAAPGAAPTRGGRSGSSSGVRTPSTYDSRRPVQNPGVDLTQSLTSTPTARRTADAGRPRAHADLDTDDVLDYLPPLDPAEVTSRADKALANPPAVKTQAPAAVNDPPAGPTPTTTSAPSHDPSGGRAVGGAGTAPAVALKPEATDPAPTPDVDATNGAVGIDRFYPVDLKLAGGSAPSTVGLGWLAEKGFRTVLDLRDASRIDSAFIAEASRRGLRYVSCPTDLAKLDAGQVERFSAELALDAARPLYFFDDDGRAAGALWYVRRVLTDKVAWDLARREAESVGLLDAASWKLARDYVDSRVEPKPAEPARPAAPAPKPPIQAQAAERSVASAPAAPPQVASAPSRPAAPQSSDVWKPFAALLVTGLSFRAAFIGRSAIPTILSRSRASLPAPKPRS